MRIASHREYFKRIAAPSPPTRSQNMVTMTHGWIVVHCTAFFCGDECTTWSHRLYGKDWNIADAWKTYNYRARGNRTTTSQFVTSMGWPVPLVANHTALLYVNMTLATLKLTALHYIWSNHRWTAYARECHWRWFAITWARCNRLYYHGKANNLQ